MDINKEELAFRLKIEGSSFDEHGTSLHELLKVYTSIEGLFDSSYSNISGFERFGKASRDTYQIILNEAKVGSWESFLKIVIAVSPGLFGGGLSPKDYLETIFVTYEFLKTVFTLRKTGELVSVKTEGKNNRVEVISGNNTSIVFNAPVTINLISNAQDCLADFRQLTGLIKSGTMSSLNIDTKSSDKKISIRSEDANLFDIAEINSTEVKNVTGEIYRYNKRSRTGKIHIIDGEGLTPGKYTFSVKKTDIQDSVIMSMLKSGGAFNVREVFMEDPITGTQIIHSLELVDV